MSEPLFLPYLYFSPTLSPSDTNACFSGRHHTASGVYGAWQRTCCWRVETEVAELQTAVTPEDSFWSQAHALSVSLSHTRTHTDLLYVWAAILLPGDLRPQCNYCQTPLSSFIQSLHWLHSSWLNYKMSNINNSKQTRFVEVVRRYLNSFYVCLSYHSFPSNIKLQHNYQHISMQLCVCISDFIRIVPPPLTITERVEVTLKVTLIRQKTVGHILAFERSHPATFLWSILWPHAAHQMEL